MPNLIKDGQVAEDTFQLHTEAENFDLEAAKSGGKILPLTVWLEHHSALPETTGVWLNSDESIDSLKEVDVNQIPVIAVNFPAFADGRGFSLARQIREQLDYSGEIRAIGGFMQDQMFYLKRCGVNAFVVSDDADFTSITQSLNDFTNAYQPGADEPRPLFRRRASA